MFLNDRELEQSEVVANRRMNRERGLSGANSYEKDLGFNPTGFLIARLRDQHSVAWLDLCCGSGRAILAAASALKPELAAGTLEIVGVDLVGMFAETELPAGVQLIQASLHDWRPSRTYDLITCVHGLHYVGDKLGLIARACGWLKDAGQFAGHLDLANVRLEDDASASRILTNSFKRHGLTYDRRRHLLSLTGRLEVNFPLHYVGADDQAGPNCTGQEAVDSYYAKN